MQRLFQLSRQIARPLWCSVWETQQLARPQLFPQCQWVHPVQQAHRLFTDGPGDLTEGEKVIIDKLKSSFPGAKSIEVTDISGGCGAMYQISIEAEEFRGKKTMMQHRLVNQVLAEEIKAMHGLQLNTKIPSQS